MTLTTHVPSFQSADALVLVTEEFNRLGYLFIGLRLFNGFHIFLILYEAL